GMPYGAPMPPPGYGVPYGAPMPAPYYAPPQVFVGGMLREDGDIPLPGGRVPARTLAQLPPVVVIPAPRPAPVARPSIQHTSGVEAAPSACAGPGCAGAACTGAACAASACVPLEQPCEAACPCAAPVAPPS